MAVLADGTVVMFGGYEDWYPNDIYTLAVSGTTATWVKMSSVGDVPSGRKCHSMAVFDDGSAVIFG
eukprot:CAMPEP_0194497238 /NCGR_PEP_ID=MMETSP0253-20130528/14245_1 /TAXON_ID=2966 /ORGANISM="Noctiluca scintillans" /LENGTH=65 /DNA_ID=CAMNT_0039338719 /DNA_START=35 /DNA_END=228 /DNA_ORIENTATION=-